MKLPASPKSCGYLIVFGLLLAIALLSLEGCTAVVTKTGSDKTHGLKFVEKCTAELLTAFGPNGPDPYGPSLFDCVTFTMQIDDPAPHPPARLFDYATRARWELEYRTVQYDSELRVSAA